MYNIYTIYIILTIYRRECDGQRLEGEGAQNDNEISSHFINIFLNETTSLATVHVESPIGWWWTRTRLAHWMASVGSTAHRASTVALFEGRSSTWLGRSSVVMLADGLTIVDTVVRIRVEVHTDTDRSVERSAWAGPLPARPSWFCSVHSKNWTVDDEVDHTLADRASGEEKPHQSDGRSEQCVLQWSFVIGFWRSLASDAL